MITKPLAREFDAQMFSHYREKCLSGDYSRSNRLKTVTNFRIIYTKTKGNGNRSVPTSRELYDLLPESGSALFSSCYSAFRKAINRTEIILPDGQLPLVLRHTFASHSMMNGGNILVLQRILGHIDIKMTMRYAHFAPNHLEEALKFNPLNKTI
ncbi:phage integrase family protein [Rahnella sp. JUb53]|nr:phage integrase family protein [Rahnella sp. JUb53]